MRSVGSAACSCRFYKPCPQSYKGPPGEIAVVDKVLLTSNEDNRFVIKCLVRHTRRPEVCALGPEVVAVRPEVVAVRPEVRAVHPEVYATYPEVRAVGLRLRAVRPSVPVALRYELHIPSCAALPASFLVLGSAYSIRAAWLCMLPVLICCFMRGGCPVQWHSATALVGAWGWRWCPLLLC